MGLDDKVRHAVQEAKGKVKELIGDATDNEDLEASGKFDQASSKVGQAGEAWKDRVKDELQESRDDASERAGDWSEKLAENAERLKDRAKRDD